MTATMTAADIRAALKLRYPSPGASIVFEVSTGTGSNVGRFVDAVAMDLWPSRGLALTAIEIKISRSDFHREVKQPAKSEAVAKYCDFFCIAAPKGLIKADELPIAWGLIEVAEDQSSKVKVNPQKTEAEPINRNFLAALLRAGTRSESGLIDSIVARHKATLDTAANERERSFLKRVQDAVEARSASTDGKKWREFLESVGEVGLFTSTSEEEAIKVFKLMRAVGVGKTYSNFKEALRTFETTSRRLREIVGDEGAADEGSA